MVRIEEECGDEFGSHSGQNGSEICHLDSSLLIIQNRPSRCFMTELHSGHRCCFGCALSDPRSVRTDSTILSIFEDVPSLISSAVNGARVVDGASESFPALLEVRCSVHSSGRNNTGFRAAVYRAGIRARWPKWGLLWNISVHQLAQETDARFLVGTAERCVKTIRAYHTYRAVLRPASYQRVFYKKAAVH